MRTGAPTVFLIAVAQIISYRHPVLPVASSGGSGRKSPSAHLHEIRVLDREPVSSHDSCDAWYLRVSCTEQAAQNT